MPEQDTAKHSADSLDQFEGVRTVLLDIEGTTTPITFVKDVLFGYVREHLEGYLEKHWEEDECQADVKALRDQAVLDEGMEGVVPIPEAVSEASSSTSPSPSPSSPSPSPSSSSPSPSSSSPSSSRTSLAAVRRAVADSIRWLMAGDRKVSALKQFQGHMWRTGYQEKTLIGEVFTDVVPAIRRWVAEGKKVYIYSSGSVEAQKLLFGHTEHGCLLELFSGHFDTKTGAKVERKSYEKIAQEVGCDPSEILFLTDVTREATPASQAGLQTAVVVRDGNAPLTEDEKKSFQLIHSFSELLPDAKPAKKLKR